MSMYTVQIEASTEAGDVWQAITPSESVDAASAEDAARDAATNQTVADGHSWRVVVWDGADADTSTEPAAFHYAEV